jgi:ABC-type dipeptide/oligopeptide/nickel transport system permease subunit
MIFSAVFTAWISPCNPHEPHPYHLFEGPSLKYLLGTDYLGRDLLSRLIYGARTAMLVSVGALSIACIIGVALGVIAGYNEGKMIDYFMILVFDTVRSFPQIILAIAIIAVLGPSIPNLILAMGFTGIPFFGRLARAQAIVIKESGYVKAAKVMGISQRKIAFRHILPNILTPIIACIGMDFAWLIVYEAGLSFLGLGVKLPNASWGIMLRNGYKYVEMSPWMIIWPSLVIALTMIGFAFFSEVLSAAIDPTKRER